MGKIIVIDGLDGCGKATQTKIVYDKLVEKGYKVKKVSFPDYDSDSSALVKMYLGGEFGKTANSVNPYTASLFYSVDRAAQFLKELREYYDNDYILLCDRYISANIIYQGTKFNDIRDKQDYFRWMYDIEVNKIGLPKDDITIALTLPIETSQKLMSRRYEGHEEKKDIHEADLEFLSNCKNTVSIACEYLSSIGYNWVDLDCSDKNGDIRSLDEINSQIMKLIESVL